MAERSNIRSPIELPDDLNRFLDAGHQLQYDPTRCEAGAVTLLPLQALKLQRFPVETSSLSVFEQDPHYPDVASYLVLGVNLVASCSESYEAVGLLLWLPIERRYAVWDSSHCTIQMFGPDVTWEQIVASPARHINAAWTDIDPDSPPMEDLVPWLSHPYGHEQIYAVQPA
jgi:hypothetical protein